MTQYYILVAAPSAPRSLQGGGDPMGGEVEIDEKEIQKARALHLLSRRRGAAPKELAEALELEPNRVRSLIGRLRQQGEQIQLTGPSRWVASRQ